MGWIPRTIKEILTTKGDLTVFGTKVDRLGVGTDDQVLTADSGEALGVKWADVAPASGGGSGEILISDTPSTPLVFADLLQNEAQDDLVYSD